MVLEQILETELFKCVMEWLSTENKCCTKTVSGLDSAQDLAATAASVCCQGTEISTGLRSETGLFCKECSVETVALNGEGPNIVVSSKIAAGNSVQGLDLLVPSAKAKIHSCSGCCAETSPANGDVLTILLLALPPQTWNGLKDTEVSKRIRTMVSTENLPLILQEEVLHLTRQLCLLKRCKDNKLDDDLGEPVV